MLVPMPFHAYAERPFEEAVALCRVIWACPGFRAFDCGGNLLQIRGL